MRLAAIYLSKKSYKLSDTESSVRRFRMYSVPDLQAFVAVARHGGITAGAAQIGVSAATTSHRISKLEDRLGVKLFHRNSRTGVLSDEGAVFLDRVELVLAELEEAEVEVRGRDADIRGHLRVTMSPWILSRFVLPHLPAFRHKHPNLTIEFLAVDRFVPLVDEGQDCAIRVGVLADSALIATKLSDNHRILCAAPSYLEKAGPPTSFDALIAAQWVCLPWQMRFDIVAPDGSRRTLQAARNVTVSNSDMLTDAAVQGLGLAVKSRLAVAQELSQGTLVEVMPGTLHAPEAPIWFLAPSSGRSSRKTRAFRQLVRHAFGGPASPE